MVEQVSVEFLDQAKAVIFSEANSYARRLRGLRHCDIRLEVGEVRACAAENGMEKQSSQDYSFSMGVRVLAGDSVVAPGYYGGLLGAADANNFPKVVRQAVRHAYERARANAEAKAATKSRFGALGDSLKSTSLAPVTPGKAVAPAIYRLDPRSVPLPKVVRLATDCSKAVASVSNQVAMNVVVAMTAVIRELFVSSEGVDLDESYALTEGFVLVVSRGQHGSLELYDFTGHQRGWEVLEEGYRGSSIDLPPLMQFCTDLARDCVEVSNAPPLKPSEGEVVVVTDPHFNALVCHEVVGHPSELDRALKMETGYAGRSWLFKSLQENQLGRQVASPLVSVFSDPTMEGFGHYRYDHEGTPARRVMNIERGTYREFLSNRETAAVLGVESNGHARANDAAMVPLIRMSNTAFAPGDRAPVEILREVERGYYVSGHRIPSASESRENFRISAMKVYEIRNGELGQLYRDGSVMADSRDFFMRVDAVGNDFRLFPIPNCGKGQPMQAKRLGNGGPTMRSIARVTGPGGD